MTIDNQLIEFKNSIELEDHAKNSSCFLDGILPNLHDGVQIWDRSGSLHSCNKVTLTQFGIPSESSQLDTQRILDKSLDENNLPLRPQHFPVHRVLESGQLATDFVLQVQGSPPIWLKMAAYPIFDSQKELIGVLSLTHEISSLVEKGKQLELDAHYDNLTGLPNRLLLSDRLNLAIAHSQRTENLLGVCLLDLDGFKQVNDELGHHAGDQLLVEAARRINENLRTDDTAVRLGGDEFVLLIGGIAHEADCLDVVQRVLSGISRPYQIQGKTAKVTASIGVTMYPLDSVVPDQLIRHADQAMYKAKAEGKNRFHLFDLTMESKLRANKHAVEGIGKALEKGQLKLFYQPKVNCVDGKIIGLEAVTRWQHPILGQILPAEFLPLIEHDDMIIKVGEWVLTSALDQLQAWRKQNLDIPISVNVAVHHLMHSGFPAFLDSLIESYPNCIQQLEIEILETAALEDINKVSKIIHDYQRQGITFALDDFGTGYSSLTHLKHLTANILKIDRSFVQAMHENPDDLVIIQGMIGLADAFQRDIIAEGVESIEQTLLLIELGCANVQGYAIARPMPAENVPGWLSSFTSDPRWRLAHSHYPDRNDFELLLLQVTHRHWLELIRTQSEKTSNHEPEEPVDYQSCRITRWYESPSMSRFRNSDQMKRIIVSHRAAHDYVDQLIALDRDKDYRLAESLEKKLTDANDRLISELKQYRESNYSENLKSISMPSTRD